MDEDRVRQRFACALNTYCQEFDNFFIAKILGLKISYPEDHCLVEFPVDDFFFNPQGSYHGGMLATIMDISMGHLIKSTTDEPGITLEMKNQYVRPLTVGPAKCRGEFIRKGRSISFLESRVWDQNDKLTACATSTWKMG